MPILIDAKELERARGRAKRARAKRMRPVRAPASEQRQFRLRLERLFDRVLKPAGERLKELIQAGASPVVIAEFMDRTLRQAEFEYGVAAQDVVWRWQMQVDRETRARMQRALGESLGVDISVVLDGEPVKSALALATTENVALIKSIPGDWLGKVARSVHDHYTGKGLPEGRTLVEQLQVLGAESRNRAKLIARDQTTKLTGTLNQVRQQAAGIDEYVWETVKDVRVAGNPGGYYPKASKDSRTHGNHYERQGRRFRWDDPPPDGHPGQAIQCRCWARPIVDAKKVLREAQVA